MKRYEALADEIAASIHAGTLRAGDRLPSVRQTAASRKVNPSTVFQAYYKLEARGLVRVRDRSGYYVAPDPAAQPHALDAASQPDTASIAVDVGERVFAILQSAMQRDVVPLGSAFPSPQLFPLQRLAKTMASTVQKLDPRISVDYLDRGSAPLRRQIALRYLIDGLHVPADDIVITNGAMEALNLCLAAVARPGDAVVIESPTFYAALQALERLGLKAIEVPTHPREGIDLTRARRGARTRSPARLLADDQFPEPARQPDAGREETRSGGAAGAPSDAVDRRRRLRRTVFRHAPADAGQGLRRAGPGHALLVVLQMPRTRLSHRLGCARPFRAEGRAPETQHDLDRLGTGRSHARRLPRTWQLRPPPAPAAPCPVGAAGCDGRRDGAHFPPQTRATRPQGGYFLWLEMPAHVDALALHSQALALGISIAPGPIFSSRGDFRHCLRLNYGHPWDARMEQALATLGRLLRAAPG